MDAQMTAHAHPGGDGEPARRNLALLVEGRLLAQKQYLRTQGSSGRK